ncbi:MAG: aminotransferase class V-fold PLP-dependent enzyme [Bacteriovoracaceae bacterium]|nr:aminotransferase class V-fold PLP-dependent enzyme [Bacteriovoracaceae bacterium]
MRDTSSKLIEKEFAHLDTLYFNSAYFGPSPYRAKQKVANALFKELDPSFFPYNTWMGFADRTRANIANLLQVDMADITHSTSSSDVLTLISLGFPFKKGDVVTAVDGDYPSNILTWMLAEERGRCKFQLLPKSLHIDAKSIEEKLDKNCKIFSISHVAFDTGRRCDLMAIGKMLKSRGILFVVDATQSLGGLRISKEELEYIDVLACSSYKWLLGPYGHAFGYFSKAAQEIIEYNNANWVKSPNSKDSGDLLNYSTKTVRGARKYDRGEPANMLVNACLDASLEFLQSVGLEEIENHNREVRDHFLQNYPKKKYQLITPTEGMGNIISIKSKGQIDVEALERELKYHNIDVSVREGKLRLSFHLFNNIEQVETLIRAMDL